MLELLFLRTVPFPQDGSNFDIKSVLNIVSASGVKKKLMNTFYMLQEKF